MSDVAHGPAEVARLILANPDLPVLKCGGDGSEEDEDSFVLHLVSAWLGAWFDAGERIYDIAEYANDWCNENWEKDGDPMRAEDLPHGPCLWLRMDYWEGANREMCEKGDGDADE